MPQRSQEHNRPPLLDMALEVGSTRLRAGIAEPGGEVYRPHLYLAVDAASGMAVHFELADPRAGQLPPALQCVARSIERLQGVPREVRVRDPKLAVELRSALSELPGLEIVVRESLPMLDEASEHIGDAGDVGIRREPGLFDVPGVTLDHVIAFADAAERFYNAAPWRHLIDDDLIEIAAPPGPKGTRFTQVLGAGGQTFGLGFVGKRADHEAMRTGAGLPRGAFWTLVFSSIDVLPFDDGEAWERHNLPRAHDQAFPEFVRVTRSSRKRTFPTPAELAWAEGLLRALAETTETELDSGRWQKQVQTHGGPMTFELSLPVLLEQMSGVARGADPAMGIHAARMAMEPMLRELAKSLGGGGGGGGVGGGGGTPAPSPEARRAQDLCYQAYDSRGRRQLQLARQALAIDPDCCEAMLLIGERAGDDDVSWYERAVKAGERRLGPQMFQRHAGRFWGILETRPYMRARQCLAVALMNRGEFAPVAENLREMLRLNPGDNQGVRYLLAQCLLHEGNLAELDELLNRSAYHDDGSAQWCFTRALLAFRREGDTARAREVLDEAARSNPYVLPLLTGRLPMPPFVPDTYSPGGEDEAVICVADTMSGWTDTPGALEWLDEIVASRMPRRRARGTGKSKSTPKPKSQKAASKKGKRPKHEPPHGESDP